MSATMMCRLQILALALSSAVLFISAGKEPTYLISFHEEGQAIEGPKKVKPFPVNGETRYFRLSPLFTQQQLTAYWPFPAEDGSYGAVFWLNTTGRHVLERIGVANRGEFVASAVNRVPIDTLFIDGQAKDGRIVIWKGLGQELFHRMDEEKKIRRINAPAPAAAVASRSGSPAPGAPLPDDAIVSAVDPAALEAATADFDRSAPEEKKGSRWNPFKKSKKEKPEPKPVETPLPPLPAAPPFPPDPLVQKGSAAPVPDSPAGR